MDYKIPQLAQLCLLSECSQSCFLLTLHKKTVTVSTCTSSSDDFSFAAGSVTLDWIRCHGYRVRRLRQKSGNDSFLLNGNKRDPEDIETLLLNTLIPSFPLVDMDHRPFNKPHTPMLNRFPFPVLKPHFLVFSFWTYLLWKEGQYFKRLLKASTRSSSKP